MAIHEGLHALDRAVSAVPPPTQSQHECRIGKALNAELRFGHGMRRAKTFDVSDKMVHARYYADLSFFVNAQFLFDSPSRHWHYANNNGEMNMTDTLSITIARLNQFEPCEDSGDRVIAALRQFNPDEGYAYSAADAREAGCTYEDIIWIASAVAMENEAVARRLTGFLNDNAKRVLHIFEEAAPDDPRVRKCIEATDAFLAGRIDAGKWERAARDARDAWDVWAARAAWTAWDAWAARATWAALDAWTAWDAWAAWTADREEFHAWQFDRLIEWLAPEAPEPLPMPGRPLVEAE